MYLCCLFGGVLWLWFWLRAVVVYFLCISLTVNSISDMCDFFGQLDMVISGAYGAYGKVVLGTRLLSGRVFRSLALASVGWASIFVPQGGIYWLLCWQLPVGWFLGLQVAQLDVYSSINGSNNCVGS